MPVGKEIAARKAAAKYSANLFSATIEYATLSGQLPDATSLMANYPKLKDEMLSLLPPYRHPIDDVFTEYMIFFDPDFMSSSGSAYEHPDFITKLEKKGVDNDILNSIRKYVKSCEQCLIEFAQCRDELSELKTMFSDAKQIYEKNCHERSEHRNALVVQAIGLSTGYPTERINKKSAYFDYVTLVRRQGLNRSEAVGTIQEKYGFNSCDATLKLLYDYRSALLKKWEEKNPLILPEIEKRLKGLIPSRR